MAAPLGFPSSFAPAANFPSPAGFPKAAAPFAPAGFPAAAAPFPGASFPTAAAPFPGASFPASFPVAKPAPAPAVVTASLPIAPAANAATPPIPAMVVANVPKAPKSRAKPKPTLATQYAEAAQELSYLKANGQSGRLKLTGAPTHLSKNTASIYHGLARLFGTIAEISAVLSDPEYQQALIAAGVNLNDLNDPNWVVNSATLAKFKAEPNSWVNLEIAEVKKRQTKVPATLDDFSAGVEVLYDALKKGKSKTAVKDDPSTAFRAKLTELQTTGKVLDVTGFDALKMKNFKAITRPQPGGRSQRSCLDSLPICATNRESILAFLNVLAMSPEDVQRIAAEWIQPGTRA